MKEILIKIGTILSAIFGVFLLGKKYAEKEIEAKENEKELELIKENNEFKKNLDNIDIDIKRQRLRQLFSKNK